MERQRCWQQYPKTSMLFAGAIDSVDANPAMEVVVVGGS